MKSPITKDRWGITKRQTGPKNRTENGMENGTENGMENGMETLTAFLEAH